MLLASWIASSGVRNVVAVATGPKISTSQTVDAGSTPVKKPGANMPMTCHSSTSAASENGMPHTSIASGVAAISRFITP